MAASRRIAKILRAIEAGKVLDPSAFNYDNVIGTIWGQETGGYDQWFMIAVVEPEKQQGGYYDNR